MGMYTGLRVKCKVKLEFSNLIESLHHKDIPKSFENDWEYAFRCCLLHA
jgi:hypothetical protein